jgi:hypothetical protein
MLGWCTVIRFLGVSAKFSTCTVVRVNGTLVEDKMRRFKGECEPFRFNKCPIYTHDGASAKFSTNSQEMDNSVVLYCVVSFQCEDDIGIYFFSILFAKSSSVRRNAGGTSVLEFLNSYGG